MIFFGSGALGLLSRKDFQRVPGGIFHGLDKAFILDRRNLALIRSG